MEQARHINNLHGCALALTLSKLLANSETPTLIVTPDSFCAQQLIEEINFFDSQLNPIYYPELETLIYDSLSPHQSVISDRIFALAELLKGGQRPFFTSIRNLLSKTPPTSFWRHFYLNLKCGDTLDYNGFKTQCVNAGYRVVSQVIQPGECAFRGSIIDIYPMGINSPIRIDLFDDEIESIKTFDEDSQLSQKTLDNIEILPAHEFPTDDNGISLFRKQWRQHFEGKSSLCPIYNDVSDGFIPPGIEYYFPLFFDETNTLFDFLPSNTHIIMINDIHQAANNCYQDALARYEQRAFDITKPILPVTELYIRADHLFKTIKSYQRTFLNQAECSKNNESIEKLTDLEINRKLQQPLKQLSTFLEQKEYQQYLIVADSQGRREVLLDMCQQADIHLTKVNSWQSFLTSEQPLAICYGNLENGSGIRSLDVAIITESHLFGSHIVKQKKQRSFDPDLLIKSLTEIKIGDPIVHIEHGVGRYQGLEIIKTSKKQEEFLVIHYAQDAKVYVPVTSLHMISRYSGGDKDHAPLHKLGSEEWQKQKNKAQKQITDVAVELLDIYAQRAAKQGHACQPPNEDYNQFISSFPFEETIDQTNATQDIIKDMCSKQPMDRLICGDVGFGKTEVAMRAAYLAIQNNMQVCVLVPTTLLATQHHQNFVDRFSELPVNIDVMSRFRTSKETGDILNKLENGTIDIIVSTHKLLQKEIQFKHLGLLIIDEEHRFGVKQKEHVKKFKTDVDILSMTATPIPRTLNLAMSGIRDMSLIATPPAKRLSIKTFWYEKQDNIIREAVLREITRGGQVFFLHNEVTTIQHIASELETLVPEAKIEIAHGQMRERQLEKIMSDFYHHKFNVLICTTIIETGIDIPSANTILINRADKFGLAQLHQLRGRVGRSHHQAYAYLLSPPPKALTNDAKQRLEALLSLEDLGAGFTLATHDLEIRGAGEFLGDDQSGHMHSLGFSLYMELLDTAVKALKSGKQPELSRALYQGPEIKLPIDATIPEHYMGDVQQRLTIYKRISNANNEAALNDIQVEMIDRFGLLPESVKRLFNITKFKIEADKLGINKISLLNNTLKFVISDKPTIKPEKIIQLIQVHSKKYKLQGPNTLSYILLEDEPMLQGISRVFNDLRS